MTDPIVGVAITAANAADALGAIRRAEEIGVPAAWLTSGGGGGDGITIVAAAAAKTERILLGTSILQTWSRRPVAVAQQVQAINSLAPGRFRLGVGPGHKQAMEDTFGVEFREPLAHLTDYLRILRGLLQKGSIDYVGRYYRAQATIPGPIDVPVLASALRPGAFELCGAEADGAISWVCPLNYVRDVALPALRKGAEKARDTAPRLIVHAPVCVHEDAGDVREGIRRQLGAFPRTRFYARMFAAAGFPNSPDLGWTDDMLDSVAISGDESTVSEKLKQVFGWGASEVLATVITVGDDRAASAERTMRLLAQVGGS